MPSMASLIRSAAVPCIGVLTATFSAWLRTRGSVLFSSGR